MFSVVWSLTFCQVRTDTIVLGWDGTHYLIASRDADAKPYSIPTTTTFNNNSSGSGSNNKNNKLLK